MNLSKKKELAAKTLGVGKNRVIFSTEGLAEIKEAITKQDIKSLYVEGIIGIKPVKGRKKVKKRKTRRGDGKIKKKVNKRKQIYVKITRKLRGYVMDLRDKGKIDRELYWDIRKKIRMRDYRSKAHLKEYLGGIGINFKVEGRKISGKGKTNKKESKDEKKNIESSIKESRDKSRGKDDKKSSRGLEDIDIKNKDNVDKEK